jgi:DNA-binding NarL/FixJ family response regulator
VKSSSIRVLIVEDDALTRAGIRDYLLSQRMDVSEASSTADALQLVEQWSPHVVVLDIVIPPRCGENVDLNRGDGIRAARLIKERDPDIGIVLLSSYPIYRPEVLDLAAQGYGGLAYLFKGERTPSELRSAIQHVSRGGLVFAPQVGQNEGCSPDETSHSLTDLERDKVDYAVSQMSELTEREWEIVELVAASRTNAGISKALHIMPSSVQSHLSHIYAKVISSENAKGALLDKRALLTKAYRIHRNRHGQDRG